MKLNLVMAIVARTRHETMEDIVHSMKLAARSVKVFLQIDSLDEGLIHALAPPLEE